MEKRPEEMNLKEIFVEMKNISELMVDLAYSSVLFDSEAIADEVCTLEETMDILNYQLTIRALLASRTREEAEQISEILNVASAIKDISSHAQNISEIVARDLDIHSVIPESLKRTDEKIFRAHLEEQSRLISCSFTISRRIRSYLPLAFEMNVSIHPMSSFVFRASCGARRLMACSSIG